VLAGTASGAAAEKIGREGARTVPCRDNGGNHDIKNFTRGARVYYPVWVPGAKFSGGDLHFSQGDGEITFCGAIGWFCLFVALTAVPVALTVLSTAAGKPWLIWLGLDWAAWAVLWFLYFVLLALGRASIGRFVGWLTLVEGILTAWIPGYLVMSGRLLTT
jgi:Acetamidase/Formamidase family/AmiS/UreI family transporter